MVNVLGRAQLIEGHFDRVTVGQSNSHFVSPVLDAQSLHEPRDSLTLRGRIRADGFAVAGAAVMDRATPTCSEPFEQVTRKTRSPENALRESRQAT